MLRGTKRREPRHVIEHFVGIGDTALWEIIGAPENGKASADSDRRQSGIELILAGNDDSCERLSVSADENLRCIKARILHGDERLVPGKTQAEFIQKCRRKDVCFVENSRLADRHVRISIERRQRTGRKCCAATLCRAGADMILY